MSTTTFPKNHDLKGRFIVIILRTQVHLIVGTLDVKCVHQLNINNIIYKKIQNYEIFRSVLIVP